MNMMVGDHADAENPSMKSKPVIIASSNLSVSEINYEALPKKSVIIRCGNFYDEDFYSLGRRVDYCLVTDVTASELHRLAQVNYSGTYDIRTHLYPGDTGNLAARLFRRQPALSDSADFLADLALHPRIAHYFMSGPRPAPPLQMLAWALIKGCSQAFMIAPELYGDARHYPFVEPTYYKATNKSSAEQRSNTTVMSIDHAFLDMLIKEFPEARICHGTTHYPANMPLENPKSIPTGERLFPAPKIVSRSRQGLSDHGRIDSPFYGVRRNQVSGTEERCAYVTFCDNEGYLFGARVLANSLAKHSQIPLVVMTPHDFRVTGSKFHSGNVRILPVQRIRSPHAPAKHQSRFENTFTKLNVFGLDFLDKAIFLDSDVAVFRSIEALFDLDSFAAAPDHGLNLMASDFNSGVFVCQPSSSTFLKLLDHVNHVQSYDGGDQGFLNEMFPERTLLPHHFNVLKRVESSLPALFDHKTMAALHFVGEKPWSVSGSREWDHLDRLWFQMLGPEESIDFILWLKRQLAAPRKKAPSQSGAPRAEDLLAMGRFDEALKAVAPILKENSRSVKHLEIARDAHLGKRQYIKALRRHLRLRKVQRQRMKSN